MNEYIYFKNDELPAEVWRFKYALNSEKNPDDMHLRMATEFAKKEFMNLKNDNSYSNLSKYGKQIQRLWGSFTEEQLINYIYDLFKNFSYICPQGSIMSMLGNPDKIGSLSNCFVVGQPEDSYGGILKTDQHLVQLMKRRAGVGTDISSLRPDTATVTNAAGSSTGPVPIANRYSNTTREVAQNARKHICALY